MAVIDAHSRAPQEFTEHEVTDIDFHFLGGDVRSITLREGDTMTDRAVDAPTHLPLYEIAKAPFGGYGEEHIDIYAHNLCTVSSRKRTERRPVQSHRPGTIVPIDPSGSQLGRG